MKKAFIISILMLILGSACSSAKIKGTTISDTPKNREIFKVFSNYVMAIKNQTPEKIIDLISENYFDTNGTDEDNDDVDYDGVKNFLQSDVFADILKIKLGVIIKDLQVMENSAKILFYYEVKFKVKDETMSSHVSVLNKNQEKWTSVNDIKTMTLQNENGAWKIISGI